MLQARSQFKTNLSRARDLRSLYIALSATTTGALDLSDMLRASVVIAVSALDHFVHEITRIGMVEIYRGARPRTDAFGRFSVIMDNVLWGAATPGSSQWLE